MTIIMKKMRRSRGAAWGRSSAAKSKV